MIKLTLRFLGLAALLWCLGFAVYAVSVTHRLPYEGNAEGIVVLTGGDGRVEAGLTLLEQERAGRLLISGVHRDVKVREILVLNGKPAALGSKIDLGFVAQDTLGNADETAEWITRHNIRSVIVVTSHYHMPRAMVHLGAQLPEVALYAYPVTPKIFTDKKWYLKREPWRLLLTDYNKFLLTYPQILLLKN